MKILAIILLTVSCAQAIPQHKEEVIQAKSSLPPALMMKQIFLDGCVHGVIVGLINQGIKQDKLNITGIVEICVSIAKEAFPDRKV